MDSIDTPKPAPKPQAKSKAIIWIAIAASAAVVLGLAGALLMILANLNKTSPSTGSKVSAETLFNNMLKTAATKNQVRLAYSHVQFASKQEFESHQPDNQIYTLTEFNLPHKEYRSIVALTTGGTHFNAIRCLDGKAWGSATKPPLVGYRDLAAVQEAFKKPFTKDESAFYMTRECKLESASHIGRITDGLIPVGLDQAQTSRWLEALQKRNLLSVGDGGITTYQQKTVRKVTVRTDAVAAANRFVTAAQEGTGLEFVGPEFLPGRDAYRLEPMAIGGAIDGFYLIDEQTKLPVYSQFNSLGWQDTEGQSFTKTGTVLRYAYSYPDRLTLGQTSILNVLQ